MRKPTTNILIIVLLLMEVIGNSSDFSSKNDLERVIICKDSIEFSITLSDLFYSNSDTVKIKLQIINNSSRNIYIMIPKTINVKFDENKNEIYTDFGGTFESEFYLLPSLTIIYSQEKYQNNFLIDLHNITHLETKKIYKFWMKTGYFILPDKFIYLFDTEKSLVKLNSQDDLILLSNSFREFILGYLPIMVEKSP